MFILYLIPPPLPISSGCASLASPMFSKSDPFDSLGFCDLVLPTSMICPQSQTLPSGLILGLPIYNSVPHLIR